MQKQRDRALHSLIESILFLDWRGDPSSNRVSRDVCPSGKAGLPPGVRQSETLWDGRFCANSSAMVLSHSENYAHRTIA